MKAGKMAAILSEIIRNPDKNVQILMVETIAKAQPFENRPSKSPDFRSQLYKSWFYEAFCQAKMFGHDIILHAARKIRLLRCSVCVERGPNLYTLSVVEV